MLLFFIPLIAIETIAKDVSFFSSNYYRAYSSILIGDFTIEFNKKNLNRNDEIGEIFFYRKV